MLAVKPRDNKNTLFPGAHTLHPKTSEALISALEKYAYTLNGYTVMDNPSTLVQRLFQVYISIYITYNMYVPDEVAKEAATKVRYAQYQMSK